MTTSNDSVNNCKMFRKVWNKIFRLSDEEEKPSRITQRTIHLDFTVNQKKESFEDEVIKEPGKIKNIPTLIEDENFEIIKVYSDPKDAGDKSHIVTLQEISQSKISGVTEVKNSKDDSDSKGDADLLQPKRKGESRNTPHKGIPREVAQATEIINRNRKIIEEIKETINLDTKIVKTATDGTNQNTKIVEETPVVIYQNIERQTADERKNPNARKRISTSREITYKFGDVWEAIASYAPSTVRELSLKTGDKIQIVDSNAISNWRKATNLRTKDIGYVHVNYLGGNLEAKPWYFGEISFYQARTLIEDGKTGTFLVYKRPYDARMPYALLLRFDNQTKNYGIYMEDNTYHISEGFYTKNLETLIEAYKQDQNLSLGLCTRLLRPCVKLDPTINDLSVDFKDKLEIARADIKIGKQKAKGYSSEVYIGKWKNKDIAIKSLLSNFSKQDFEKEVLLLKKLKHNNIVQFYGISTQQKPYLIILEYMKFGDLATYIKKQALEEYQRIHIASQIADGMAYLAKEGVVHRDLAARNVLLQDKLTAKISDFGISRLTDDENEIYLAVTHRKLPIRWLAPECATESKYSEQSDVWAFSILLMEIYTRQRPYKELTMLGNPEEFLQKIKGGYRMGKPDNMPDDIFDMCTLCWNEDNKLRPKFKDISIFFHDFINCKAQIL